MRLAANGKVALGLLLLSALPGCATTSSVLSRPEPPADLRERCHSLPAACRERVHVYMINGLTFLPHMVGSMNSVAPYIEDLGFSKTKVGTHYSRWSFQDEIRRIHAQDPGAHFVLIGYSIGGGVVHAMAESLRADGISIDLMVLIDGHSFRHRLSETPANVERVVAINSASPWLAGQSFASQASYSVNAFFHLAAPRREETLRILGNELIHTAAAIHAK